MTLPFRKPTHHPLEILVVDDDYAWQCLVAFHLELYMGIQPIMASSGEEALEIIAARPVDVVIADLFMPEMDGFQFLLRAQRRSPATKVILISGDFSSFPVSPEQLLQLGALAAIPKAEIGSTLETVLRDLQTR